ncbi:transmembrane protein 14C [Leptinotarsa decemlineata]|uniref:transmembrane protein 14C n=1 Tax=Leptinotarsa decemlineata TaxID=7539 RepID=UPI003D30574A
MALDVVGLLYAGVVAAGGIFGYYKAGSIPSLGAGLLFGGALAYGAVEVSRDPSNFTVQLVTSSILGGLMGYRFYNTHKIMPAGVICLLSLAMVIRIGLKATILPTPKQN